MSEQLAFELDAPRDDVHRVALDLAREAPRARGRAPSPRELDLAAHAIAMRRQAELEERLRVVQAARPCRCEHPLLLDEGCLKCGRHITTNQEDR